MTIELFAMAPSAPCRTVALALEVTGTKYDFKKTDLQAGDHMKPEYLKMNPQHTVPTFKDGDFVLTESRAIAGYVANAYDKSGKLYPTDAKVRAVIDSRLYFDMGVFYKTFGETVYPIMLGGEKEVAQEKFDKLKEVLALVNGWVKPTGYVAGTASLTIADLAFLSSYSTIKAAGSVCTEEFTELNAWFEKVKGEVPNYEKADGEGAAAFGGWYKSKKAEVSK